MGIGNCVREEYQDRYGGEPVAIYGTISSKAYDNSGGKKFTARIDGADGSDCLVQLVEYMPVRNDRSSAYDLKFKVGDPVEVIGRSRSDIAEVLGESCYVKIGSMTKMK